MTSFTVEQIGAHVSGRVEGPADLSLTGIEMIDRADDGHLTFIGTREYAAKWPDSRASAALIGEDLDLDPGAGRALIRVPNADLALANVLELFAPPVPSPPAGVHPTAVVDATATLGAGVAIGPCCYVGPRARIGDGTVLHPNVSILDDTVIGAGCTLWPGAVVRERCEVGDGSILHANATVGADGFGYRPAADGRSLVKIPHIGSVRIGRDVEIGASTCIDRGKFSATTIGDGTKIDNLVQIGHNCRIGRCAIIVSMCGFGGTAEVGDGAMIGGNSSINDHVTIGAGAKLGGHSAVLNDIPPGAVYQGTPAQPARSVFRQYASIAKLPELLRTVKRLDAASRKDG